MEYLVDALWWICAALTVAFLFFWQHDPLVRGEEQDCFENERNYSKGISRRVLK